jgi:hypothetical protein
VTAWNKNNHHPSKIPPPTAAATTTATTSATSTSTSTIATITNLGKKYQDLHPDHTDYFRYLGERRTIEGAYQETKILQISSALQQPLLLLRQQYHKLPSSE